LRGVRAWWRARGVDVVLANTVLAWWAVAAAHRARRPSLWLIHESDPPFAAVRTAWSRARARRALGRADRVVFPAHATREVYTGIAPRARLSVFHNGFDAASYDARLVGRSRAEVRARLKLSSDDVVGVLVGTVSHRKSQIDAVNAVAALPDAVAARLKLFIVGDVPGSYSHELHRATRLLTSGAVRIVPYSNDVLDYYLAADFALSTSKMEAFPKVVQEAMYFGLPLVVAPAFGIAEQVEDEVSALTFPVGDVTALTAKLERIVTDAELRRRLGEGARAALARLPSMSEMVAQYAEWLQDLSTMPRPHPSR